MLAVGLAFVNQIQVATPDSFLADQHDNVTVVNRKKLMIGSAVQETLNRPIREMNSFRDIMARMTTFIIWTRIL
jgi:hypothetical protein